MNETPLNHFKSLLALGLITDKQYQQATTHERLVGLTTVESDADALFRAAICGVVNEGELEALSDQLAAVQAPSPEERAKLAIVKEALSYIGAAIRSLNREPLDALLALDLINAEQHEAGLDVRPIRAEGPMDSPARALAILVNRGVVPEERLREIKAQGLENSRQANAKERLAIVTEAAEIYHGIVGQLVKAMAGGAWRVFGLTVLAIFGFIGVIVMAAWAFSSNAMPPCKSDTVTDTVSSMLFMVHVSTKTRYPLPIERSGESGGRPRLRDVREVGYEKVERVRGCLATVETGETQETYAFTVRPAVDKTSGQQSFMVVGANPVIVEARFGRIGADGRYAEAAQPIGRGNVEKALRSGVESFNASVAPYRGSLAVLKRMNRHADRTLYETAPERQREIAEVEPMAACREIEADRRYACRLMVEHNDPVFAAMGTKKSMVLDAEFTFERVDAGAAWQVSEEFPKEYMRAITEARSKPLSSP